MRQLSHPAVHAAQTVMRSCSGMGRPLAIAAAGGVFLALAAPFGMSPIPLIRRLPYWVGVLVVGTLVGRGLARWFERIGWLQDRPWVEAAALVASLTTLLTGVVWLATRAAFGAKAAASPLDMVLPVLLVSAAMTAVNFLAQRQPAETHAAPVGAPPPKFLERLPPKLRGARLYAVEAEDHYLRLHTDLGSDLILLRLSDAVAELEGLEGARTHRSWWVARDGFSDVRRGEGRATLVLRSGREAPVSRTYAKALREEGWF